MHLVNPLTNISLKEAYNALSAVHDFLVECCKNSIFGIPQNNSHWGIQTKRHFVDLRSHNKPAEVGKDEERFAEVVNIIATVERLIDALDWFGRQDDFKSFVVAICHPSTSSAKNSNDLRLKDANGYVVVWCEVCDIASSKADQNGKEKKDIASLGCTNAVPRDGVRRFLCTSPEFADAIFARNQKSSLLPYNYALYRTRNAQNTTMLEVT